MPFSDMLYLQWNSMSGSGAAHKHCNVMGPLLAELK